MLNKWFCLPIAILCFAACTPSEPSVLTQNPSSLSLELQIPTIDNVWLVKTFPLSSGTQNFKVPWQEIFRNCEGTRGVRVVMMVFLKGQDSRVNYFVKVQLGGQGWSHDPSEFTFDKSHSVTAVRTSASDCSDLTVTVTTT